MSLDSKIAKQRVSCIPVLLVLCVIAAAVPAAARVQNATVHQYLDEGKVLAAANRLAEASILLEKAIKLSQDNIEIITLLGKVEGRMGQLQASIAHLRRAADLAPSRPNAHIDLAISLADAGELPGALKEVSLALVLDPNSSSGHLNKARILADLHEPRKAEKEFAIAHRLEPGNPDVIFYWALVERDSESLAEETKLLRKLVQLQPQNDKAFFLLGQSLAEQSQDSDAVLALKQALVINPQSADSLYMLWRKLRNEDPEEAARLKKRFDATRERKAEIEASKSLGNEAYIASTQRNWPEAIRFFRQALTSCGDCEIAATLHKNLGLVLCKDGNVQDGVRELNLAFKINPNDPDTVQALAIMTK